MNKYRFFYVNPNGKIELTPEELEELINDAFCEGQENCGHDHKCTCEHHSDEKDTRAEPNPDAITIKVGGEADYNKAIEALASLMKHNKLFEPMCPNDAFTNLKKELGM